jgi:outer membrane protein
MSKKIFFSIVLGLLFLTPSLFSQARIAYINSEQVIMQLPESQEAQKILEELQISARDSIQLLEETYKEKLDEYQLLESQLTEEAKRLKQTELMELQNYYSVFTRRKSDEIQKRRDDLMRPILEKIQKAIDQLAKDEGLNFIFDKTATVPVLLYGDNQYNLTNKLLDILIRGIKTPSKRR